MRLHVSIVQGVVIVLFCFHHINIDGFKKTFVDYEANSSVS